MKKIGTILVVSPDKNRIRHIQIRPWVVGGLFLLILAGFTGYILPFNQFAIDIIERNQQRNLEKSNLQLLQRIRVVQHKLMALGTSLKQLENRKKHLSDIPGLARTDTGVHEEEVQKKEPVTIEGVLSFHEKKNSVLARFMSLLDSNVSLLDSLPLRDPMPDDLITISNRFGKQRDPFTGTIKMHNGVDYIAPRGSPIIAPAAGRVKKIEKHAMWGNRLLLLHSRGFSTVYAHLGTVQVASGQAVSRGDTLGTIGMSGRTTGPHLHYEILHHDTPIDPLQIIFPRNLPAQESTFVTQGN